jgi:hypothetical protein
MLRTSFHWRCSVFLRFASPEMLPRVPLYQVVDVEFVPGTRLLLYVGLHTDAWTTIPVVIPGPRDDYWYPFYLRFDTHVPFVLIPGSQDPGAT